MLSFAVLEALISEAGPLAGKTSLNEPLGLTKVQGNQEYQKFSSK